MSTNDTKSRDWWTCKADLLFPYGVNRVHVDIFSRRHMAQKIYLRQAAAQDWVSNREYILQGERPHSGHELQLRACDQELARVRCKPLSVQPRAQTSLKE